MADEAANVEILKGAYKSWGDSKGASVDAWMAICADNIAFGSLAQGAVPSAQYLTAYNNRDSLKAYFDGLARDWQMLSWEVKHYVAQGDRVAVVSHCVWRNKKTGKTVSTPKADVWRMSGGKAVEYYEYFDTAQAHAATT